MSSKINETVHTVVGGLALANTAGIAGDIVSLENHHRCRVLVALAPASGTDTAAITLKQSQDAAGTGIKALAFTVAHRAAYATSDVPAEIAVTANSITTSATAVAELFSIDVAASDLDTANGFTWLSCNLSDPGSVSTPAVILYQMYEARYSGPIFATAIA